jgi:hypothetical protein
MFVYFPNTGFEGGENIFKKKRKRNSNLLESAKNNKFHI